MNLPVVTVVDLTSAISAEGANCAPTAMGAECVAAGTATAAITAGFAISVVGFLYNSALRRV